jgi:hypothetical protein
MGKIIGLKNVDGIVYKDNKKYFGYGTNYYSLLTDYLVDNIDYKKGIDTLEKNNIPYARFNCGIYYPSEMSIFNQKGIESLIKIAEYATKKGVGLIPSFFWNCMCLPDYFDEPLNSWGDKNSNTFKLMMQYTKNIVEAVKDYESIWGWEFGNEFNLNIDLPNRMENIPPVPNNSKRKSRDEKDQMTSNNLITALDTFSEIVSSIDNYGRIISSGNAVLRASQYNQATSLSWKHDTIEEHNDIITNLHPNKIDCISEHIYFDTDNYFDIENYSAKDYIYNAVSICKKIKKVYIIGEFGDCGIIAPNKYYGYKVMAERMAKSGVQLALAWNYDPLEKTEFSYGKDGEKQSYIFEVLREINNNYSEIKVLK